MPKGCLLKQYLLPFRCNAGFYVLITLMCWWRWCVGFIGLRKIGETVYWLNKGLTTRSTALEGRRICVRSFFSSPFFCSSSSSSPSPLHPSTVLRIFAEPAWTRIRMHSQHECGKACAKEEVVMRIPGVNDAPEQPGHHPTQTSPL